jgi:hypothetical protein
LGKQRRALRVELLDQVANLDGIADSTGLDEDGWALRYHLEDQIIHLDSMEEDYWRQRSRLKWTLQGDACTAYFHAFANGRRRKCMIPRLITDAGEVSEQQDLVEHIYEFYQGLMGSVGEDRVFSLAQDLWPDDRRVSEEENLGLELTFTPEELDEVLAGMKPDSAPGPDGLPVAFFRKFWENLKGPILAILNDFALGRVDISRLNYGIISLIPKVRGPTLLDSLDRLPSLTSFLSLSLERTLRDFPRLPIGRWTAARLLSLRGDACMRECWHCMRLRMNCGSRI